METALSTAAQTAYLFVFIIAGYILARTGTVDKKGAGVLAKLENNIFIPALIFGTFLSNFTPETLKTAGKTMLTGFGVGLAAIAFALLFSRMLTKDLYLRRIFTYGLAFSNFGFMGNAVVMKVYPGLFFEYLIFTLPLWMMIYMWGVPELLTDGPEKKKDLFGRLKNFISPMFIAMLIGAAAGISGTQLPEWCVSAVDTAGGCMSPVAMILTGMVISEIPPKETFTDLKIYEVSAIRLLVMPLIFIAAAKAINIGGNIYILAVCSLAMPLGLNTIVIPAAYGKDTTAAAKMAVVSTAMSVITVPFIFAIMLR